MTIHFEIREKMENCKALTQRGTFEDFNSLNFRSMLETRYPLDRYEHKFWREEVTVIPMVW